MRGSNAEIALRMESSTSIQSISDMRFPAIARTPKLSVDVATGRCADRSCDVCKLTVFSSQRRSRSTAARNCSCVSIALSRGSWRRAGSLSIKRSSSDG
ncbi:hypothetical protein D3C86_1935300 [compost metagenome]